MPLQLGQKYTAHLVSDKFSVSSASPRKATVHSVSTPDGTCVLVGRWNDTGELVSQGLTEVCRKRLASCAGISTESDADTQTALLVLAGVIPAPGLRLVQAPSSVRSAPRKRAK
ncbi:hypothetical protein K8R03_02475 [Candidatus Kaiserbacteria bacterium]|nr:hypothetical protein [Candidatus Kaiserbacteria bacterium]